MTEFWKGEIEDLYKEAVPLVREMGYASTPLLQRRLRLGYAKAARLMDLMEERGVVSVMNGAKPREILPYDEQSLSALKE